MAESCVRFAQALIVVVASACAACGGEVKTTSDAGFDGPAVDTSTKTFAIRRLFLGETRRDGSFDESAWKEFGFNLDGKVTTNNSTDRCARRVGTPSSIQTDGTGGIDNAFGASLNLLFRAWLGVPSISQSANNAIAAGESTTLITVAGLSDDPAQAAKSLRASAFPTAPFEGTFPGFAAALDLAVLREGLADGTSLAAGSKVSFRTAYVATGTFVAVDSNAVLHIHIELAPNSPLDVAIHDPIISFVHSDPSTAARGVLAGVLDPDEIVESARRMARSTVPYQVCGSKFDGLEKQIRDLADIMLDRTNPKDVPCNALSIGIGFEATLVANPTRVGEGAPLPPDLCAADAGAD